MKVYISYSPGSSIAYCFWKYFFRACGVWVTTRKIDQGWQLDKAEQPHLVILDKKTRTKYESPSSNIVYCVKGIDGPGQTRSDLVKISQWSGMRHSVIRRLFAGNENLSVFMELMDIFGGDYDSYGELKAEGLWSAVWLFHEIGQRAEKEEWDREIYEKAETALDLLRQSRRTCWHKEYMKLYCRYLQCGVSRSSLETMYQCKELLEQCADLSDRGEDPALDFLIGKIRLLSATENKYAVHYFKELNDYEPQPDLLYEIGHVYETAYGKNSLALSYYQKAYRLDPTYYRALYKFAVKLEDSGEWIKAVSVYNRVRQIVHKGKLKNDISVRDFEYEFKTCRRMLRLCRKYMDDDEIEDGFRAYIEDMRDHQEKYVSFTKLFQKMFLPQNQQEKEQEMREVLNRKLEVDCIY